VRNKQELIRRRFPRRHGNGYAAGDADKDDRSVSTRPELGEPVLDLVSRGLESLPEALVRSDSEPAPTDGVPRPAAERRLQRALVGRLRSVRRTARRAIIVSAVAAALAVATVSALLVKDVFGQAAAVERVIEKVGPSTVFIESSWRGQRVGSGTGWVLDARRGLIVTNAHVINGGSTFSVMAGNELRSASIVGAAPCEDLAVLRLDEREGLETMPLGTQASLRLGQTVVAIGYPANASGEAALTATLGVVSVIRTTYREDALDIPRYPNVIQTDAAVNPGNSGGPLVLLNGRLVGVNTAGRTLSPDGRIIQGQSYAIGVERVKEIANALRRGESFGWSGLGFDYPAEAELSRERLPPGIFLTHAVPGTGGAKAGLADERALLVAVNGTPISNSLASYCDVVGAIRSGQTARFTVIQPGRGKRTVQLTME
jgi:S1-C subfamily serine protease